MHALSSRLAMCPTCVRSSCWAWRQTIINLGTITSWACLRPPPPCPSSRLASPAASFTLLVHSSRPLLALNPRCHLTLPKDPTEMTTLDLCRRPSPSSWVTLPLRHPSRGSLRHCSLDPSPRMLVFIDIIKQPSNLQIPSQIRHWCKGVPSSSRLMVRYIRVKRS